jgi:hypothetical protein
VIVPNSDTPYSMLSPDLRAERMVLSVHAVEKGRDYSVQLCDAKHVQQRLHRQSGDG